MVFLYYFSVNLYCLPGIIISGNVIIIRVDEYQERFQGGQILAAIRFSGQCAPRGTNQA
jgi:hypothetical protein